MTPQGDSRYWEVLMYATVRLNKLKSNTLIAVWNWRQVSVQNRKVGASVKPYSEPVRKKELTPKQAYSVPCPTCEDAIGKRCELNSGEGAETHKYPKCDVMCRVKWPTSEEKNLGHLPKLDVHTHGGNRRAAHTSRK